MARILLVDDHAIVREGFKRLIEGAGEFEVVAEAANAETALVAVRALLPDIVVIDLSLGSGRGGLTLIPQLAAIAPEARLVVLSMHDDPGLVVRAQECGAHGYITKAVASDELPDILRQVGEGKFVLSSDLAASARRYHHEPALSERERITLRGILSGKPPKVVAAELGISDKTLYRHRANLFEKLGARTANDLARIARERGLLIG